MPTNYITFKQPLFPVGIKLEVVESKQAGSYTSTPDSYVNITTLTGVELQQHDRLIVVCNDMHVEYKVV